MKHLLFILFTAALCTQAMAQTTATERARAAVTAEQWQLVQAAMIEQRDKITAAHVANLSTAAATAAAESEKLKAKLTKTTAELEQAQADATATQSQVQAQLNTVLSGIEDVLKAELKTGEGPKTAALKNLNAAVKAAKDRAGKKADEKRAEDLAAEIAARQEELAKLKAAKP